MVVLFAAKKTENKKRNLFVVVVVQLIVLFTTTSTATAQQQVLQPNNPDDGIEYDGHYYEKYGSSSADDKKTWAQAKDAAETYVRVGCAGFGHLVTIETEQENDAVGNLCGSDDSCWMGLYREDTTPDDDDWTWKWINSGDVMDLRGSGRGQWDGVRPDGDGTCVHFWNNESSSSSMWNDENCSKPLSYIVEYDCERTTTTNNNNGQQDDEWDVTFLGATATFDNSTEPEIVVTYEGSPPNGGAKYYKQTVMLPPNDDEEDASGGQCVSQLTNPEASAVVPAVFGILPESDYDAGSSVLTTRVDINTSIIASSTEFWTSNQGGSGGSGGGGGGGVIDFCLRVDLYNEQHYSLAMEVTRITLTVDTTANFDAIQLVSLQNEIVSASEQAVSVDYPVRAEFCDDSNSVVTPAPTLFPGDVLQICVSSPSSDAVVTDVVSLAFANDLISLSGAPLRLTVIDENGKATNGQTLKACDDATGICNIKTITMSTLYQHDTDGNGDLEDVSNGAKMQGTAVLNFARRQRRQRRNVRRNLRSLATGMAADDHDHRLLASTRSTTGFDVDLAQSFAIPDHSNNQDGAIMSNNQGGAFSAVGTMAGMIGALALVAGTVMVMLFLVYSHYYRGGRGLRDVGDPSSELSFDDKDNQVHGSDDFDNKNNFEDDNFDDDDDDDDDDFDVEVDDDFDDEASCGSSGSRQRRQETANIISSPRSPTSSPKSPLSSPKSPLRLPKLPQSPLRLPKSPLRLPKSPLRLPKSPLRLPKSPLRRSSNISRDDNNMYASIQPLQDEEEE